MPIHTDSTPSVPLVPDAAPVETMPSIVPEQIPAMSDDECLWRLAQTVSDPDSDHLAELALLLGRLAVTIE